MQPEVRHRNDPAPEALERRDYVRNSVLFVCIGVLLYLGVYVASEAFVYRYGERNRFFMVKTAPYEHYDFVLLGASHAMPFGYEDMNERLEQMTRSRMMNLSIEGAGVIPNRLLLDYFLQSHSADTVIYMIDSFVLYSREWNEDRLADAELFQRAPFDLDLAGTLYRYPAARSQLLDYVLGFSKINNPDRFEPDKSDAELHDFRTTYRPFPYLDRQRIDYLYPESIDPGLFRRYANELESLIQFVQSHDMQFVLMMLPLPDRVHDMLGDEPEFAGLMDTLVSKYGVPVLDFSTVSNDPAYFYDTDHLNRDGVLNFSHTYFADVLLQYKH